MLTEKLNEVLTRVGPGTPMGELFRRFWLPALVASEIAEPDSPPKRIRILCEDLLAFRDSSGKVGIIEAYCSHRLAPLFFGRNEECGLRCPYHGWKFDVNGKCVDMPNVPNSDSPRTRERGDIRAYPTREAGGLIWVYMGPKELEPPLPEFEWMGLPEGHCHVSRWLQRTNYSMGMEGEIDTAHISFLHKDFDPSKSYLTGTGADLAEDGAPKLTLRETDYGFTYGARRNMPDGRKFWRQTHWFAPMFSLIPMIPNEYVGAGGRAWVPIDDDHTTTFSYWFRVDRPLGDGPDLKVLESGAAFPPRMKPGTFALPDGGVIDTFLPLANKENDFLIDRDMQRNDNFSGIWGANEQDRALQEGMRSIGRKHPGIVDRSKEHLMASDLAVVTARNKLLKMASDLEKGIEPACAQSGKSFAVRSITKICDEVDFDAFVETFKDEIKAPSAR